MYKHMYKHMYNTSISTCIRTCIYTCSASLMPSAVPSEEADGVVESLCATSCALHVPSVPCMSHRLLCVTLVPYMLHQCTTATVLLNTLISTSCALYIVCPAYCIVRPV